ncbi:hypothetical protein ABIA30_003103 [Mycobacterium sp. MAA66]|uniref:hypothetical protein n=1 Tax=Mycobacterium sp. MAA66 TaxID=3156297 RepID=UPI003514F4A8
MRQADPMKFLVRGAGVFGIAGALVLAGAGPAVADDVVGQTFRDAKQAIANRGGKYDVSTTVGDRQRLDDCIVSAAHRATNRDDRGRSTGVKVLLDLNCYGVYDGSHSGYSLGSPQGRRIHDAQLAKAQQLEQEQMAREQAALEAQQQAELEAEQAAQ